MAEMYNYWCPYCGVGYSVAAVDLERFKCPKQECQALFKGMVGKAVVVPKITQPDSPFKFKDMRFETTAVKKVWEPNSDAVVVTANEHDAGDNGSGDDSGVVDFSDELGVAVDGTDHGAGSEKKKQGRKKRSRKIEDNIEGNY